MKGNTAVPLEVSDKQKMSRAFLLWDAEPHPAQAGTDAPCRRLRGRLQCPNTTARCHHKHL